MIISYSTYTVTRCYRAGTTAAAGRVPEGGYNIVLSYICNALYYRAGTTAAAGGVPEGGHPVGAHRLLRQHGHLQPHWYVFKRHHQ